LSRKVIERGSKGFEKVVAIFGDGILRSGDIDRRLLGELVFSNVSKRRKLEEIIHPLVRDAFDEAVAHLHGNDLLVYEIPLLVETNATSRFDYVITVETDAEVRVERLKKRGMLPSDIDARMSAQATSDQRIECADYVIWNNGSADDLLREVEHVWETVIPSLQREKS
jgi:dephospho-CoA kinase